MCTLRNTKWNCKVVVSLINYNIPLSFSHHLHHLGESCKIHVLLFLSLLLAPIFPTLVTLPPPFPSLPPFPSFLPPLSHFSEIGAIWNSNQGSLKPRALDPWNWFGHWCFQTEKEGTEEPLPQGHWANVWGQIKCCSLTYSCAGGDLVVFQFWSFQPCWAVC